MYCISTLTTPNEHNHNADIVSTMQRQTKILFMVEDSSVQK